MSISFNHVNGVSPMSLQGMDIETALTAVQSQRATLLENQLRGQLESVATKNTAIGKSNEQMNAKRSELAALENEAKLVELQAPRLELQAMKSQLEVVLNRDPNGWTGLSYGWAGDDAQASKDMLARVTAQGLTSTKQPTDIDKNGTMDAHGSTLKEWITQIDAKIANTPDLSAKIANTPDLSAKIATVKADIDNLKSSIDAMSNSQQMDMLRLQSLSNKRNEAFDVMSNFMKKMQDNRSSIIGNMR